MKTKNMILTALFASLTAAGAFIRLPVGPVPVTLQDLFAVLSGIVLGPALGAVSQLVYILAGLAGLPVFASGSAGPAAVFSPTFGYLAGFILASVLAGFLRGRGPKIGFPRLLLAAACSMIVIYLIGVPYLYLILNRVLHVKISLIHTLETGCLIFLPGDAVKAFAAALVGTRVLPALKNSRRP